MKTRLLRYFIMFIAIVIGLTALTTPRVKESENVFSANRAYSDIKVIASEPHTVEDPDALFDVRFYLFDKLYSLGLNPYITTYSVTDDEYAISEVNNIIGVLEGESDSYILLIAHYDSSPGKREGESAGSLGAADDGYGLSTILETINVLTKNNVEMKNGIKVLFTDGEEVGLYGAEKEVEINPSFFDDVAFIINVEARGVKGASIMFQTSLDNYRVIKFYQKADYPVSFSLAGDVYSRMPNSTDFTPMLDYGLDGINMAVLDNLDYYHTPKDNPDNVSLTSLQHYGEVVYPLVKEFVSNEKYSDVDYFESDTNATYFTVLPNIFVVYSTNSQLIFVIFTIVLFGFNIYLSLKSKTISLINLVKCTGVWTLLMFLLLLDGLIISNILSWITGIPFSITYMPKIPFALGIFIIFMLLYTIVIGFIIMKLVKIKNNENSLLYGGFMLNAVFMLIFTFVLPGGVYLFMIPLLLGNLVLTINALLIKNEIGNKKIYRIIESSNLIISILLFAPILYLLYLALTIGALGLTSLFLVFPLAIILPTIERLEKSHS